MNSHSRSNADTVPATEVLPAPDLLTTIDEAEPSSDHPATFQPEDEPFIPRKKFTPGRSTKVLVCVLLVVAGFFGGTVVQKQIDVGNRAARFNTGNFQGTNGPGSPTSATQAPGQGRRGGNGGGTAPTGAAGQ